MSYEGTWIDDHPAGKGKYIYTDGTICSGEFEDEKLDGKGYKIWGNNSPYFGHKYESN